MADGDLNNIDYSLYDVEAGAYGASGSPFLTWNPPHHHAHMEHVAPPPPPPSIHDVRAEVRAAMEQFVATQQADQIRQRQELVTDIIGALNRQHIGHLGAVPRGPPVGSPPPQHTAIHLPLSSTPLPDRHINVRGIEKLDKLADDISLQDFIMWRAQWEDFCNICHLSSYPVSQQVSVLRMVMTTRMLQTVEHVLNISSSAAVSPSHILDQIHDNIRKKKSVALDRLQFEECRQQTNETFDQFFIRLQCIASCSDLCGHCYEQRMTTRIIAGINDPEARKKLLAKKNFPSLSDDVDLCRAEESAGKN